MTQPTADAARLDTTRLQPLARAYSQSAILWEALDLKVFTHVAHGHKPA